jgi:protein-disulfide isomerase
MSPFTGISRARRLAGVVSVFVLASGAWLPACAAEQKAAAKDGQQVLAEIDGQPITEAQVRQEAPQNGLQQVIENRLLETAAKAKEMTKEAFLAAEVKPAEVTDADADAFYEENKARIPRPKDETLIGQIKQYLTAQRQQEARQQLIARLEAEHQVVYKLEPQRVEVAAVGPAKGPENAPVTIVEFSDFQCPYCARLVPTIEQVLTNYGDKVRVVFRQFPLNFHQFAQKAAEASLCANEQGKFWELHDAMFQNQQQLAVENLKARAVELGLNGEQFNACLDGGKFAQQVQADFQDGSKAGVSGTPAMFVNGRFINGAVPYPEVAKVIDDELKRKGIKTAAK